LTSGERERRQLRFFEASLNKVGDASSKRAPWPAQF
jgi:hypothetical protein